MHIQSALTLAIEIIFWAFVSLMFSDFINGIFDLQISTTTVISVTQLQVVSKPAVSVIAPQFEPIHNPWELELEPQITILKPQFEEIPDPWKLELDFSNSMVKTQSVLLPFPALRLLPPALEVQSKPKRTRTTKKTTSTAKTKSEKAESPRKPGRPRKKVA